MSHLYYHIKGRGKGPPTVRHFNNKKITKLVLITKNHLKAMKIIRLCR